MLTISTKGRYASRIMVYLAGLGPGGKATSDEISRAEGVSPEYVQQILATLAAAGLVRSQRGRAGGFSLAVDPETTSLAEVLQATEGRIAPAPCVSPSTCERASQCPTRGVWLEAAHLLEDLFKRTTLAQLARQAAEKSANAVETRDA